MSTTLLLGSLLALAGAAQTAMPPSSDKEVPQTVSEDERLVRDADITPDAAGLLAFFRKRTLTEDDRRGMARLVAQLGARSFVRREEASRRLQEWGPPALSFLTPAARLGTDLEVVRRAERIIDFISQGPGPNLPRAGARLLVRLRPPEAVGVLLDYLPYADDDTVQEEVLDALAALGSQKDRLAPLQGAVRSSLPVQRAAAGFVLGRQTDKEQRALVHPLLSDKETIVRYRTAQGLLAGHDKAAVPALIDLLAGQPPELTWQVQDLLLRVAGEAGPSAPVQNDPDDWKQYRDRFARWWKENGDKVDLAKIEQEPPLRGWTVIAQMSTNKVYEVDRQGKLRWTVENLQGPIDAQVLPGDRVLVAEHHGSVVSERTFKGEIVWQRKLPDRPVQAQRLPNGNTFITTYSALHEVTRDGKEVYCYRPDNTAGRIYAGQKMRNGRIVCITLEGRILEIDSVNGKVLRSVQSGLNGCYSVQGLAGGNFLVASYNEGKVHEIDGNAKIIWQHNLPSAYHAERLPSGNTMITSHGGSRVIEIDRTGKVILDHNTGNQNVWRARRR